MTNEQIIFEACKLLAQALTALAVSGLAVRWALSRYKKEKIWERRLQAYSEVLAALAEMITTTGILFDHYARLSELSNESVVQFGARYIAARRRFEEAAAGAALVLPDRTTARINKLLGDLEGTADAPSSAEAEDMEYKLLRDAVKDLQHFGRKDLA